MKQKGLFMFLTCIVAVLALSAHPSFAAPKTLKIGAIYSLSGWAAPGETPAYEGAVLAVDWINGKGGVNVKGEKYLLELVVEDTKSSPEGIIAAAQKLISENKVDFLIGGVISVMNVAATTVAEPAGVLRVAQYNCLDPNEISAKTPLTFCCVGTTYGGAKPAFTYLKEQYPKAKKLAVIHPGDGGMVPINKLTYPIAEKLGLTHIYTGEWPVETVDFNPIVAKALAAKPDVLYFTNGWAYHLGSMVKAARAQGYKGPLFSINVEPLNEIIQHAGSPEAAEGYWIPSWDILNPKMPPIVAEIVKMGKAKFNRPHHWHLWGWSAIWTLVQAIESTQSLESVKIANHWRTMKTIETPWGTGTMGGLETFGINNFVDTPRAIMQVKKGKVELIKWFRSPTP